jgi:abhydrolase domain-containing protein 12
MQPLNDEFLARSRRFFAILGFLYLGAVILLAVPWIQSQ